VGIAQGSFLRASLLLYTLPLLLLFLGSYLGSMYGSTELPAIQGSLAGLAFGQLIARYLGRRLALSSRYQPVLINVI
jgi:sigma-E factor negative regulatory protein RseC